LEEFKRDRRRVLGALTFGAAALEFGVAASARAETAATPQLMANVRHVDAGVLNIGYLEQGPADGPVVILLHGFPFDVHSYSQVAPMLASKGFRTIVPYLRGYGPTVFLDKSTPRSGEQAALGSDVIALMDALGVKKAIFAGFDWGARAACSAAILWPERCAGLVSVNGYLIYDIAKSGVPAKPDRELSIWYQFYFQSERGRAGFTAYRSDLAKLLWRQWSPKWRFDDATFDQTAVAYDNPDFIDVVVQNYRHRFNLAEGDPRYAALQMRLAALPPITVPTVTLDGDSDGAVPASDGKAAAAKFTGKRTHHIIAGAGHNLPQEAPDAFVAAIVEVAGLT
jgi:pimeloyl-ACP methyl ester carboxylesterase